MAAIRWHEVGNGESAESVGWDQGHITLTDLLMMMTVMMVLVMMIAIMESLQDGVMYKPGARFYDEATDSTLVIFLHC